MAPQDTFIDDEDDTWEAEFRANIQKNQKKRASEQRQKEVQKREAERENRKNLQGVRVVQKNLVYVTGLTPTVREDELLKTLRKPEFFGQYGNIQKISISNRKSSDGQQQSLGIYVTFEKKEDAAKCIAAVHGSQNGDRVLKAQLGTTKYCSAWLRHEQCGNRQCMFLHELGDEEDSYSRQDLSSLNSVHTQRPLSNAASSSRSVSRAHPSAVHPATSQPMIRSSSKEDSEAGDGPALPASANWARTTQQRSRRGSHATSVAASPAISTSLPAATSSIHEANETTTSPEASRKAERQGTDTHVATEPVGSKPQSSIDDPRDWDFFRRVLEDTRPAFEAKTYPNDEIPPMFDLNGAARRRAMRDEDENRLGEQDDQVDNLTQSDGELESGSLALGGEPEDRDPARGRLGYDPRQNASNQRGNASDLFGPSLTAFGPASATVGSIGSRNMTPQQQQSIYSRPQNTFTDQMPPGISPQQPSQQANVFQGQGHTRQQSRFSFANDNSASTINVKTSGDPRYMAQQSSMMPSFRSQPGGQLYTTSVSGPPPGLKSTGTPPVGGGMFGQGHVFGGSAFGGASKSNSNDLLQSLIRSNVGNQAHDGKREYMFPQISSFHSQFPSSTSPTPAPAPGLLATLYAPQPGAFPDYGPKQKKKGKKHRHANTSSSGGSGLVDLADPSILQARMHHQQQGNSMGAGQGLFGGQAQDDDLLPLDAASSAVDALVSDSYSSDFPDTISQFDGTSSTSVPPGLGFTHAHPLSSIFGERIQSPLSPDRPQSRNNAVRSISTTIARPVTPLAPKSMKQAAVRGKDESPASNNDARKSIKELANTSGLAQDIAAQASKTKANLLQEEDFPALDSVKTASPSKTAGTPSKLNQALKTTSSKKATADAANKMPAETKSRRSEKRPIPGILDIAAATNTIPQPAPGKKAEISNQSSTQASSGPQSGKTQLTSAIATPTPTTASVSSPLAKAAPKTLRLVQTPKTEIPVTNIAPAAVASIRSAAASSSAHRPTTPASEIVSDTASIVSASISASRTSSPPPSKIGSLPARPTTKSQQRKQRKEASKEAAAQIADTKPFEPEVEVAPILGRKKKQKKEKKPTGTSRTSTRPATPSTTDAVEDKAVAELYGANKATATRKDSTAGIPAKEQTKISKEKGKPPISSPKSPTTVDTSIKLNESTKTTVLTPDYIGHAPEAKQEQPVEQDIGDIPQLRDVFGSLMGDGDLPTVEKISFFKPLPTHRLDPNTSGSISLPPTLKAIVTKEDEEKLNAFQPVRKIVNDHSVLLTPNGDCVLNLTPGEEELYLELQDRLRSDSIRPTAFSATRHAPASGFSLVKNRAVPNGPPSFFPLGPDNYPSDPVGKMHREEAISCINQHVLPSLNLGSYKTMGATSNFTKNVNLQQLAPWIYPPTDNAEDQRKMFTGRSTDEYGAPSGGHSADGLYGGYEHPENGPSPAIGSTPLMSVEDAETVWSQAKKQHEALDKKFRQLQAKNRRLVDLH
ncbi:hypothetical protein NPX13_g6483 [Xylaria arbuscula]|uniref:RRM domain-containing protein n=1 Tax=Xylaria arbuscula TaxID=114810 RepID=A0A9W8TK30_9PEZI|nr:hypothetical protein NPX13_g6483 [Xylaria arbuscula]